MFVRSCLFMTRHRLFALVLIATLTLPAAFWARQAAFSSKLSDYYPSQHPHVQLYQEFTEMLKMTNTVVVTVTVREGTIFSSEALGKIHRLTVSLLDTKGVNPFEVMSLTHPRLKDIKVSSKGINILPVVEHPDQPHPPEELAHIKNAVYTNLGIRGVYVSPDEKTALIRAGFWDGMAEPRAVFARLQPLAEKEQDANTEIEFTGNLILAAWLIDAAPRFLLIMLVSAAAAFFFTGQMVGFMRGAVAVLLINLVGAAWGFGLLAMRGSTLEPLAVIALFPLCIRGIALVVHWQYRLMSAYTAVASPFAQGEHREQALERTAATLGRPFTTALCVDGAALFALTRSDVPALQALGYLSSGWILGLLVAVWTVLPFWSALINTQTASRSWGTRLSEQLSSLLQLLFRSSSVVYGGSAIVVLLGIIAAVQLQAGQAMLGATLFYDTHPFNRALSLVNDKFIGGNQFIVIAQAPSEAAFRDPQALEALEAFQHYMAEDIQFGGALAITSLTKSITRMFHEDVPKWEIIPDDINSAGQVIFRIISSAATPSEVERFISPDYHTTAITFFYKNYSPEIVDRILARARSFITQQQNGIVQFRVGGGILGVLAAVHTAVEHAYWRTIGFLILLAGIGGWIGGKSFRSALSFMGGVIFVQGILLSVSWLGRIDFNVYTLPAFVLCAGVMVILLSIILIDNTEPQPSDSSILATSLITVAAGIPWLFSSLRLQAEIGGLFLCLAVALAVIPFVVRHLHGGTAKQSG